MDWKLRSEIAQVFASESVRYHYEVMNEVWLTAAKLSEQIHNYIIARTPAIFNILYNWLLVPERENQIIGMTKKIAILFRCVVII